MSANYSRIVKDDPSTAVTLDVAALAEALYLMSACKVRGLSLTKRLCWVAHIQRSGVLYQREFPFSDKASALAWLICTRAELKANGLDADGRGKWRRKQAPADAA